MTTKTVTNIALVSEALQKIKERLVRDLEFYKGDFLRAERLELALIRIDEALLGVGRAKHHLGKVQQMSKKEEPEEEDYDWRRDPSNLDLCGYGGEELL